MDGLRAYPYIMRVRSFLSMLLLVLACGSEREAPRPTYRPRDPSPGEPREPVAPSPWPTDVTTLAESIEGFESFESCQASLRETLPVEVSELLADLGYEGAVSDLCRSLQAAATGDAALCDALTTSVVRASCRRRVALVSGDPELCPTTSDGRDPLCLAWATKNVHLCAAAGSADRARCIAVTTDDAEACDARTELSPAACRALVTRLGPLVDGEASPLPETQFDVVLLEKESDDVVLAFPGASAAHGIVVRAGACPTSFTLVSAPRATPDARVELTVFTEPARLGPSTLFEPRSLAGRTLTGEVTLDEFTAERGATVAGHFETELDLSGRPTRLRVSFRSFVRDLESCSSP